MKTLLVPSLLRRCRGNLVFVVSRLNLNGRQLKESDDMDLPKIGKNVGVVKWLEAYANYAGQKIGARGAPRALVIRENAAVEGTPPALATDQKKLASGKNSPQNYFVRRKLAEPGC